MDRRHRRVIEIPQLIRRTILASAAEVYPNETFGFLIGDSKIQSAFPVQQTNRSPKRVWFFDEIGDRVSEVLDDLIVGDFHSHPNTTAYLSKLDTSSLFADVHSADGHISLVVGIWPGKRVPWRTLWSVYYLDKGRSRKGKIKWI